MADYSKSVIYKAVCNDLTYYGSTTNLERRMITHLSAYKRWCADKTNPNVSINQLYERGTPVFQIIEQYPCKNAYELVQREKLHIQNNVCVNALKYQGENKENRKVKDQERYQKNIDERREYGRNYARANKDKRREYQREYMRKYRQKN